MDFDSRDEKVEFPASPEFFLDSTAGGKLLIFGTMHVSPNFRATVDQIIREEHPDLILVELDSTRLKILESLERGDIIVPPQGAAGGNLIEKMQELQVSLGTQQGTLPGGEMLQAVQTARQLRIAYDLIDLPFEEIAQQILQAPESEQEGLAAAMQELDSDLDIGELTDVLADPSLLTTMLVEFTQEFPVVGTAILTTREDHMVHAIQQWLEGSDHRKILVVCGLGHKDRLLAALSKN